MQSETKESSNYHFNQAKLSIGLLKPCVRLGEADMQRKRRWGWF
jgi:hypothetical protein